MPRMGAHVPPEDPLAEAAARGADLVQFFLGDPQGWQTPEPRPDADLLRAAGVDLYIHAPYRLNVASTNNRIRIPSRKLLEDQARAAGAIGAKGLIVHGGHVLKSDDPAVGYQNWRKTLERTEFDVPLLIENTAGGDNAMARTLESIGRLWEALDGFDVGFVLDTCHAHAAGIDLIDVVDRVKAITGRIDLVHCNDSRDPFGSSRDRHTSLGRGEIDPELLVGVVRAANAPVVVETPGGAAEHAADLAFLRERL
ncbi:MAG: deoxyribonuclease IV [Mycobacteriales bacterium]